MLHHGESAEFASYLFGKDSAYSRPEVDGQAYALRHVHLVPLTDVLALTKWNQAWRRKSRKTSDRVLVYVQDGNNDCLLIFIPPEPVAHDIASMKTTQDQAIMRGFAGVTAAFIIA